MATVSKNSIYLNAWLLLLVPLSGHTKSIDITPSIGIEETYSDNVTASNSRKESSLVSQVDASIAASYQSKLAKFDFDATSTQLWYTHDHDLDSNYTDLEANGSLFLWESGPQVSVKALIENISRNTAENLFADLINANTVQMDTYQADISYDISNSDFIFAPVVIYRLKESEDGIGESESIISQLNFSNGSAARLFMWQVEGSYSDSENNNQTGRYYTVEAKAGLMMPAWHLTPFVRYFDEDTSGSIGGNVVTSMSSIGPGLRYQMNQKFSLEVSYNYVDDEEVTSDYLAAEVNWKPSQRTSLEASYASRFYGDSYAFDLSHTTRRLTNTINYDETLEVFDRDFYRSVLEGVYWCPASENILTSDCLLDEGQNIDDYQLVSIYSPQLVEANEFSIRKTLLWTSTLALSRTTFVLTLTGNERESLDTAIVDRRKGAKLEVSRKISSKTNFKMSYSFDNSEFDTDNVGNNFQSDYYRRYTTSLDKQLNETITSEVFISYLDRNSTAIDRSYSESRIAIRISKEF